MWITHNKFSHKGDILMIKISDLHTDLLTSEIDKKTYLKKNEKWIYSLALAIFRGKRNTEKIKEILNEFFYLKKESVYYSLEDAGYLTEENLDEFIFDNLAYISLTWNYENELAYGAYSSGKLKDKGKRIVTLLNSRKIAIDMAHLSKESFYDLMGIGDRIINSHTCFSAVNRHERNISDEQIKMIIDKKGIIGLTLVKDFLGDKYKGVDGVVSHIDYFVSRFDYRHLGLGTDFFGTDKLPKGIKSYRNIDKIVEKLFKLGYNQTVVDCIIRDNVANYLKGK